MAAVSGRVLAGRLRSKIDIQTFTGVSDGAGGRTKTWATTTPAISAQVVPIVGGEAFAQGLARNTQFYDVTIRYREGVSPANRVVWKGINLNIRSCADPDDRRESIVMRCESGAPEPA